MPATAAPRSSAVSVLAWNLIGLGLVAALLSALQLVIVGVLLPPGALRQALDDLAAGMDVPDMLVTVVDHLEAWLAVLLAMGLVTLVAGLGLLKRREWARVVVIWMMAANVLAHVAAVAVPLVPSSAPPGSRMAPASPVIDGQAAIVLMLVTLGLVVGVCAASVWVIRLLRAPHVRAEFASTTRREPA